jgi:hypothetical protein
MQYITSSNACLPKTTTRVKTKWAAKMGMSIRRTFELCKGPSTRVRIAVRFRARFVRKQNRKPILFLLPIAMVCLLISAKKITCLTPLAANRTPKRTGIRLENRTCRRPLTKLYLILYILRVKRPGSGVTEISIEPQMILLRLCSGDWFVIIYHCIANCFLWTTIQTKFES